MQCAEIVDCELTEERTVTDFLAYVHHSFPDSCIRIGAECARRAQKGQDHHTIPIWFEGLQDRSVPID